MAGEVIANFDSYVMVAVGLFIAGLFAVMVYERSSAKAKREQKEGAHRNRPQTLKSENRYHHAEHIVIDKFKKEGFSSLTTIQRKVLPVISRKINCLLVAPTGSGKTEGSRLARVYYACQPRA